MKKLLLVILKISSVILLPLVIGTCNEMDTIIISPAIEGNILTNSSFEINGSPSITGWQLYEIDSTSLKFSNDVPPGGGKFALYIKNDWPYGPWLQQNVRTHQGHHVYRFSCWAKSRYFADADVWFGLKTSDSIITLQHFSFGDTVWTCKSFVDTLNTTPGDSFYVNIFGPIVDIARVGMAVSFDLCEVEILR